MQYYEKDGEEIQKACSSVRLCANRGMEMIPVPKDLFTRLCHQQQVLAGILSELRVKEALAKLLWDMHWWVTAVVLLAVIVRMVCVLVGTDPPITFADAAFLLCAIVISPTSTRSKSNFCVAESTSGSRRCLDIQTS
jgi:hypothetical protein